MKCPNCSAQSDGAFCSQCGAPLKGAKCRECQAPLQPGARFCNNCGTAIGSGGRNDRLPWLIAAGALVLLIGVLAWPAFNGNDQPEPDGRVPLDQMDQGFGQPAADAGNAPPPLTGSPREQADRLFNRIMSERESGDTAQAKFFLPMALQAYENASPLDDDGHYHLSLLQSLAGDFKGAQATAEKILATSPNHLLGLAAAASAARAAGDNTAARNFYQRFLSAYDAENKTQRQEYVDHGNILSAIKVEAEAFVR